MLSARRMFTIIAGFILVLALGYVLAPLYNFLAEDNPAFRGPFGWQRVPKDAPYVEGHVDPAYAEAAAAAKPILETRRAEIHAPSISAAVAVDGRLVWSAVSGFADLEQTRAASTRSLYRIGSTSKAVTGTLLARMVDAKLVELDTPISTYIDELPNPQWEAVTLRQLASHTAGIPSYEANRDWIGVYRALALREHHENVAEGLDYFDDSPLMFEPGSGFEYSSYDVNLMSVVLQEAGHAAFDLLMEEWVTRPLGLDSPIPDGPHEDRVSFYELDGEHARLSPSADLSHKLAGGGFMARPEELVMVGAAWLDPSFISDETREAFWEPQRLADGSVNEQGYAISWRFSEELWWSDLQLANANHGGVSKGSMAWLVVIPEERMAIALAINTRVLPFGDWAEIQGDLVKTFTGRHRGTAI